MNLGIDSCLEEYENIEIPVSQVQDLIINYLIHNCYDKTLSEFPNKTNLQIRKQILTLISTGKPKEARNLLKGMEIGNEIDFLLATLEFVEMIKVSDYEYLNFDFSRFTNQPMLPELISLIAFENPKSHLLSQNYRDFVVGKVNLVLMNGVECGLETIVKQAICVRDCLTEQNGEFPTWKLSNL